MNASYEKTQNHYCVSVYVELGMSASSTATLNFAFGAAAHSRKFEIRVSQYDCGSPMRPREGCLQYFTGIAGRITSFNFEANLHHLNDQQYSICIRQEEGFCCTQYSLCSDESSFTLDDVNNAAGAEAEHGTYCDEDYVTIEGSSNICNGRTYFSR